jgi:hypothetical protein
VRVDLLDPAGAVARPLSGVLRLGTDGADWTARLPPAATAGRWTLQVTDGLTGRSITRTLTVAPP